jgi:hypothetical protein
MGNPAYYKWTTTFVLSGTFKKRLIDLSASPAMAASDRVLAQRVAEKLHTARGTTIAVAKHAGLLGRSLVGFPIVVYVTPDEHDMLRVSVTDDATAFAPRGRKENT